MAMPLPGRRRAGFTTVLLAAVGVTAACGGSGASPAGSPPTTSSVAAGDAACPAPTAQPAPSWPEQLPGDFPKPTPARVVAGQDQPGGVRVAQFVVPRSLREEAAFVLQRLPRAGYVLGHGDAEAKEADTPFTHDGVRGRIRLSALGACRTQWTVVTYTGTTP